jgi:hypothetical protein
VPVIAFVAVVTALSVVSVAREKGEPWAGAAQCAPTVPPAEPEPADTRLSRVARVFVSPHATPDQRNLIQAAIFRVTASVGSNFTWDPGTSEFQGTYCGDAAFPMSAVPRLAYFFTVWFSSPGAYPALVAEVGAMPGVVAVQRAPKDD